jgi:hypothetical protein
MSIMATVESLENSIKQLSAADLAKFRAWFAEFDAAAWDAQIESDAASGKLDSLAQEALEEYKNGTAREL